MALLNIKTGDVDVWKLISLITVSLCPHAIVKPVLARFQGRRSPSDEEQSVITLQQRPVSKHGIKWDYRRFSWVPFLFNTQCALQLAALTTLLALQLAALTTLLALQLAALTTLLALSAPNTWHFSRGGQHKVSTVPMSHVSHFHTLATLSHTPNATAWNCKCPEIIL
jgi:hypothetical protein